VAARYVNAQEEAAVSQRDQKQGSSGNKGQDRVSPVAIEKAIKGLDFPASKDDLVRQAQRNNAPQDVMEKIRGLPGNTFNRPTDLTRALGQTQ